MPSEEVGLILQADDPELIRHHLELHLERLQERLADQRRTVRMLEQLLVERSIAAARGEQVRHTKPA